MDSQEKYYKQISKVLANYNFTEDEIDEALAEAQRKKEAAENMAEYARKVKQEIVYPTYNDYQLRSMIKDKFDVDKNNEHVINALCLYFSGHPDFETLDKSYSHKKGVLLWGSVGVGKTKLMKFFSQNQRICFGVVPCRGIVSEFKDKDNGGDVVINRYSQIRQGLTKQKTWGRECMSYCYDDLGSEGVGIRYKDEVNVMAAVIETLYANQSVYGHFPFHLTTNLTTKEIEEGYGTRVRDRLREMFNVISFPVEATSRRK
jgi:DNA replication protein DnaC